MAYCFEKSDRTIEDGVRRIALEQIDKALETAHPDALPRDDRIHRLRKGCKKLRGLVRMVQPVFDGYAAENTAIRDAAAGLSGARDAEVMIATLDMLSVDTGDKEAFAAFRDHLTARRDTSPDGEADALAAFRVSLQAVRDRANDWRLDDTGFDALSGGIVIAAARARKAMKRARKDPAAETVHDWRKRVKDHWYHSRLLVPLWPAPMDTHARAADRLGDLLGQHHDLAVLVARAEAESDMLGPSGRKLLRSLVARRQATLEANCFALGARLFAEPAEALAHRWRGYWKVWRKEDEARVV